MSIWRRRTDDARRTKGDPPATYAQLMAEIRETQAAIAKATEVAINLRSQADGLSKENARLRLRVAEGICGDEAEPVLGDDAPAAICKLLHGHLSEWHEDEGGMRWKNARPDPDPTGGYIAAWETRYAETGQVPAENDPWKDELR